MSGQAAPAEAPVVHTVGIGNVSDRQREAIALLSGPQKHTMLVGGSRSSKTFFECRNVLLRAIKTPVSRHTILRQVRADIESSIWEETLPKVRDVCCPWLDWDMNKSNLRIRLPNEAVIQLGGLDDKARIEKILGTENATLYFNECSQIGYSAVAIALTRLAQRVFTETGKLLKPRAFYDLNPTGTAHWTHKLFLEKIDPVSKLALSDPGDYAHMFLSPLDNLQNLSPDYIKTLEALPERQKKRFLVGKYAAEVENPLWTAERIESSRCNPADVPDLQRIVVAIDPSGASGKEDKRSDEIGIVVAGLGVDGRGYVLGDHTCLDGPAGWGKKAVEVYLLNAADLIVGETNYGGDMVLFVVKTAAKDLDVSVNTEKITATRGKVVRAEPISALYDQDMVRHVGTFEAMEDEMLNMSTAGYQGSRSPNRLDALVWALTKLMLGSTQYAFGST